MMMTIIRFFGLWIFSVMIYKLNQMKTPTEFDETREKVEALVAAGEVDLEEVKPEFVEGMLVLDLILRTVLVSAFCTVLWGMLM